MTAEEDAVIACADLLDRAGAKGFEIGYMHEGVPAEDAGWYVTAQYQGGRIMTDEHPSPGAAAVAMAERILRGGACRCGRPSAVRRGQEGCLWLLVGQRWEPSCDAPTIWIPGPRGDVQAMGQAIQQQADNRAARRAQKKRRGRRG